MAQAHETVTASNTQPAMSSIKSLSSVAARQKLIINLSKSEAWSKNAMPLFKIG